MATPVAGQNWVEMEGDTNFWIGQRVLVMGNSTTVRV